MRKLILAGALLAAIATPAAAEQYWTIAPITGVGAVGNDLKYPQYKDSLYVGFEDRSWLPEKCAKMPGLLMKDDETPGGFVFIDEPFAHLDVRNIQLVGHFLRSTRAQYLLTTPITHNVEVFEPSEITLVTSKKPRGERWDPPIAVRAGRPEVSEYA